MKILNKKISDMTDKELKEYIKQCVETLNKNIKIESLGVIYNGKLYSNNNSTNSDIDIYIAEKEEV